MSPMKSHPLAVAGTGNYHTYRIPAVVVSTAGTVLAFCEGRRDSARDDSPIDLLLWRSFDDGDTWSAPQVVVNDGDRTCGNPCPVVDAGSGRIWLPFCKDNQQVFVCHSDDDGLRWSEPQEITSSVKDPGWSYLGTGPGHGIQLPAGRLLIPCWMDQSPGPVTWRQPDMSWGQIQTSYAFYSDDGGASWQRGESLTADASDECEAAWIDGRVYVTLRSRHDRRCRGYAWSEDGGHSWSPVAYDESLPEPSCQASIVALDGQRAVLAGPADPEARACLMLRRSDDGGHTWPTARVLYEGAAAYSDLAVAPGGDLLCLFEADDYSRLVLVRVSPSWLDG